MLHIKLKGMKHNEGNEAYMYMHTSKLFALIQPSTPWVGSKGKNHFFCHVAYQIKGYEA